MFLIALLVVFLLTGVFAAQNDGTQVFSYLGYTWHLPVWGPAAIGVGLVSALLLLHMGTAGIGHRFRQFGHTREVDEHRGTIVQLRDENARLREELAALRGAASARSGAAGSGSGSWQDGVRSFGSRLVGR